MRGTRLVLFAAHGSAHQMYPTSTPEAAAVSILRFVSRRQDRFGLRRTVSGFGRPDVEAAAVRLDKALALHQVQPRLRLRDAVLHGACRRRHGFECDVKRGRVLKLRWQVELQPHAAAQALNAVRWEAHGPWDCGW